MFEPAVPVCDVSHDLLKGENICFLTQASKGASVMNGRGFSAEAAGSGGPGGGHGALGLREGGKKGPEPRRP